jgi:hypothetical protein
LDAARGVKLVGLTGHARIVPVASKTAVITSASTLGSTAADSAPRISMAPISEV